MAYEGLAFRLMYSFSLSFSYLCNPGDSHVHFLLLSVLFFSSITSLTTFSFDVLPSHLQSTEGEDFLPEMINGDHQLRTDFHPWLLIMDLLITDNSGSIPFVNWWATQKDEWIILNAPTIGIPTEALYYKLCCPDDPRATGPTGVFLEMEWGLDMDWYDHNTCWCPYIPVKTASTDGEPLSGSGSDWFFDFDATTPYEHFLTGVFIVPESTHDQIHADITTWAGCIEDICSNNPFPPGTARPPDFHHRPLIQGFSSLDALQAVGGVCKRTAVNYLGFLLWWTLSVSQWDMNLDHHVLAIIQKLDLCRFQKQGVLVNLETSWREINIPNLVQHGVPVAYLWSSVLASSPRFTCLSP